MTSEATVSFHDLGLNKAVLKALDAVGYETPSPIQAQTIPFMLAGSDLVGQAQTGTGKTAAFALPILSNLALKQKFPQVLVLAPTRELAIQVSEAFQKYAAHLKDFHVLPVYGGQEYGGQIRALKRGVHIVVGTPGRVMDHIRKGVLKLDKLRTLVLDEGDEMLRMGFIDDVEWVMQQLPVKRQVALFSATMPTRIRRIAEKYLDQPSQITIKVKTTTAATIRQRYWVVSGGQKLDALTRLLESEEFDAMIIFVRTKTATVDVADKLAARGYASIALNGDIPQNIRQRTIDQLKKGKFDILVATDVAARGLDVGRISHVVNYDIPHDTESYVHRIGRTGRAGREGDAILFVAPREKRMLNVIEQATRQKIEMMEAPSTDIINQRRIFRFKQKISETIENVDLKLFSRLIEEYQKETGVDSLLVASALAQLMQGDTPFLLSGQLARSPSGKKQDNRSNETRRNKDRIERKDKPDGKPDKSGKAPDKGMERFKLGVGHQHKVMPGNIVGAIANEVGLDSQHIGRISIYNDFSTVDLPEGMPKEVFDLLKKVRVGSHRLNISKMSEEPSARKAAKTRKPSPAGVRRKENKKRSRPNS